MNWYLCFYLLPLPGKTFMCLSIHLFYFLFHAAGFPPNITGRLFCLILNFSHITMDESSHLCSIFFHMFHILSYLFRGELPHLSQLIFLLVNYLFCLLEASTPRLFCLLVIITPYLPFKIFGGGHHTLSLPLSQMTPSLSQTTPPPYNASSAACPHIKPQSTLPICQPFPGGY